MKQEDIAASFLPLAYAEMERGNQLRKKGLFTEAGLRFGRASEAALYGCAAHLGVTVVDKEIKVLKDLRQGLQQVETEILRAGAGSSEKVSNLANCAKNLAKAVHCLAEDCANREGTISEEPRRTDALLKEILSAVQDSDIRAKLQEQQGPLRMIQEKRNQAAHANCHGESQELTKDDVRELKTLVGDLVSALAVAIIRWRSILQARIIGSDAAVEARN